MEPVQLHAQGPANEKAKINTPANYDGEAKQKTQS